MSDTAKLTCIHCHWRGQSDEILSAPNPFDAVDTIHGCPQCKTIGGFENCCDEPGCWSPVVAGTPTPAGYRCTCHEHKPRDA